MPKALVCTFDSQWFKTPPEWWGTWLNESEHPVTFEYQVQIDGLYPKEKDTQIVPGLHVCMFGGWMGIMGARWWWKARWPNHPTVELKGYDRFSPRVDNRELLAAIELEGYGKNQVAAKPELKWELYRWPP